MDTFNKGLFLILFLVMFVWLAIQSAQLDALQRKIKQINPPVEVRLNGEIIELSKEQMILIREVVK